MPNSFSPATAYSALAMQGRPPWGWVIGCQVAMRAAMISASVTHVGEPRTNRCGLGLVPRDVGGFTGTGSEQALRRTDDNG